MFTLIYLWIRALATNVSIHGYGDFRIQVSNCMDFGTYIFLGILFAFWIVCVLASKCEAEECEVKRAVDYIDKAATVVFFPFLLLSFTDSAADKTTLNEPSNNVVFILGCVLLVVYFIYTLVVCKKIAKSNIFYVFKEYLFFEGVIAIITLLLFKLIS